MDSTPTDQDFTEFVHAAWPGLYRTAYLMLGDHQLAEDLTQTALAKTYGSWRKVKDPAAAPAYARVVLANTAASWFRRRSWRNEHPTESLPEVGVEHDPSTRTAVVDALATLAPRQRAVVVLRYYDDLSVREVAQALGISEGTVKSQTSDALGRLRGLLVDHDVPPAPVDGVLADGRAIRRRRRTTAAVVGAVVAVVLAAGGIAVLDRWGPDDAISPAEQRAYRERGAWASTDGEVHVGDHVVDLPDVVGLHYTAAGVVVATGANTDAANDSVEQTLVDPGGSRHDLGPLGTIASDPATSEVVYVRAADEIGTWQLVVLDVATGDERLLGEPFATRQKPSLAMAGPYVVYLRGARMVTIDRQTGETGLLPEQNLTFTSFESFGPAGYLTRDTPFGEPMQNWEVRSLPGGDLVGTYPAEGAIAAQVSPDGRFLATSDGRRVVVYDVATARPTALELDSRSRRIGWSPDGHLVAAQGTVMTVCDPVEGGCEEIGAAPGDIELVVASGAYGYGEG